MLNRKLVKQQKLSVEDVIDLWNLHNQKDIMFNYSIEDLWDSGLPIYEYVDDMTELEFSMQKAWKFDQNADYHSHWFLDPKCTCPTMDNQERVGSGQVIISESCPLHGKQGDEYEAA